MQFAELSGTISGLTAQYYKSPLPHPKALRVFAVLGYSSALLSSAQQGFYMRHALLESLGESARAFVA